MYVKTLQKQNASKINLLCYTTESHLAIINQEIALWLSSRYTREYNWFDDKGFQGINTLHD